MNLNPYTATKQYLQYCNGRVQLIYHGQCEFRERSSKSIVASENIDVVRELITQDRHMTYREFKSTLGLGTYSIIYWMIYWR